MQVQPDPISAISYDPPRAKLFVEFADGERYIYVGVPGEVHRRFVKSPSKGRFFQNEIRGRYPFNRLEDGQPELAGRHRKRRKT